MRGTDGSTVGFTTASSADDLAWCRRRSSRWSRRPRARRLGSPARRRGPAAGTGRRRRRADDLELGDDVAALGEAAVGEHHPLRSPGRAGRVDDEVRVVERSRRRCAAVSSSSLSRRPGADSEATVGRSSMLWSGCITTMCCSEGSVGPDLSILATCAGVLADDDAGTRVAGHPRALLGRVRRVDRHDHGRRGADRQVGDGPLEARVGQDAHTVACREPEIDQALGQVVHPLPELAVGDVDPAAIDLVAGGHLGAVARAARSSANAAIVEMAATAVSVVLVGSSGIGALSVSRGERSSRALARLYRFVRARGRGQVRNTSVSSPLDGPTRGCSLKSIREGSTRRPHRG